MTFFFWEVGVRQFADNLTISPCVSPGVSQRLPGYLTNIAVAPPGDHGLIELSESSSNDCHDHPPHFWLKSDAGFLFSTFSLDWPAGVAHLLPRLYWTRLSKCRTCSYPKPWQDQFREQTNLYRAIITNIAQLFGSGFMITQRTSSPTTGKNHHGRDLMNVSLRPPRTRQVIKTTSYVRGWSRKPYGTLHILDIKICILGSFARKSWMGEEDLNHEITHPGVPNDVLQRLTTC